MGRLILRESPELVEPYLIVGLAGWPNAGEVSTETVSYLVKGLRAKKFARMEAEDFYYLPNLRPWIRVEEGVVRAFKFPANDFFFWKSPKATHDLILMAGIEPHLQWRRYINLVLGVAERFAVKRLCTIGGTYDWVPHTREPRISILVNNPTLRDEVAAYGMKLSSYQGPTSLQSALLLLARERNIPGISLWGHVPYYIRIPEARVCLSLVLKLSQMLGFEVEVSPLAQEARSLEEKMARVIQSNAELGEYVRRLEEAYDRGQPQELPENSEKLLQEVEEFLKRAKGGSEGGVV